MPASVARAEVRRLVAAGAQLVDVLAESEFREEHLRGAVSIPLRSVAHRSHELDSTRAVIVYCHDSL